MRIAVPASAPWLLPFAKAIERALGEVPDGPVRLKPYSKTELPSAADYRHAAIVVTDDVGGQVMALSDGTNWRRQTDRSIIS